MQKRRFAHLQNFQGVQLHTPHTIFHSPWGHIRRDGLLRLVTIFNIRGQRQDTEVLIFCFESKL